MEVEREVAVRPAVDIQGWMLDMTRIIDAKVATGG
jgi:hypothetical protein